MLDGDNQSWIEENSFGLNDYNVISDGTGYNFNWINCNEMVSQYGGILMEYDNQKSTFLSNEFIGTSGFDYGAWAADIIDEVGSVDESALNIFSGVERDIDSKEEDGNEYFDYYIPETVSSELIPTYDGNYGLKIGEDEGISCSTVTPPIITKTDISTTITDYCYWLRKYKENPSNWYYRWKYHQIEKILHYKLYYWYKQRYEEKNWVEIEEIMKRLCGDRWKIKLFGHYLKIKEYNKAKEVLNELNDSDIAEIPIIPEDLSDESRASFVKIQDINLLYQESDGNYQFSETEINTLREEAVKNIPERAFARGLLLLATGEKFNREIPELFRGELEPRESKSDISGNWSIFPNPADNTIFVECDGVFEGSIKIYNIFGSLMVENNMKSKGNSKLDFDISSFKEGLYILIVKDINGNVIKSEKIVITKVK